jgi:hypothetical protein
MGNECDREDAAKIDLVTNKANGDELLGGLVGDVEEERRVLSLSDDNNYPDSTFFKCGVGFMAWALWGFIPIHNTAGMQSDLFGDAKISFIWKKDGVRKMRRLSIEQSAASVDNHRGRKRRSTEEGSTEEEQQQEQINNRQSVHTPTVPRLSFDTKAILAKTLQYLNADSLEKERQKNTAYFDRGIGTPSTPCTVPGTWYSEYSVRYVCVFG